MFKIEVYNGKASIWTPYNKIFVERVKLLGAKWDASLRCWTIGESVVSDVRAAMREIYGRDDQPVSETVDVELTFTEDIAAARRPVTIAGRTIASAYGRDSGARIGDDVVFVAGSPESGGSVKNWCTVVPAGCIVKLYALPKAVLNGLILPVGVSMRVIGRDKDVEALKLERETLLARLAEIDALLAESNQIEGGKNE